MGWFLPDDLFDTSTFTANLWLSTWYRRLMFLSNKNGITKPHVYLSQGHAFWPASLSPETFQHICLFKTPTAAIRWSNCRCWTVYQPPLGGGLYAGRTDASPEYQAATGHEGGADWLRFYLGARVLVDLDTTVYKAIVNHPTFTGSGVVQTINIRVIYYCF